ncbi:MAG: hypothetical protein FJ029_12890 [Actinobacteria bacterium]|nr:hypothetical protein [Actinomycetota bacterium]
MRALFALVATPLVGRVRRRIAQLAVADEAQGVPAYALVTVVFVTVLIVVLAALGDSIGVFLQGLVDQLPFGI